MSTTPKKTKTSTTESTSNRPRIIRLDAGVIEQQRKITTAQDIAKDWSCERCGSTNADVVFQDIVEFIIDPVARTVWCGGRESDTRYPRCQDCGHDDRW